MPSCTKTRTQADIQDKSHPVTTTSFLTTLLILWLMREEDTEATTADTFDGPTALVGKNSPVTIHYW
ncbi:hypothetical protein P7K49_002894, partial [Saguinus oedipus]